MVAPWVDGRDTAHVAARHTQHSRCHTLANAVNAVPSPAKTGTPGLGYWGVGMGTTKRHAGRGALLVGLFVALLTGLLAGGGMVAGAATGAEAVTGQAAGDEPLGVAVSPSTGLRGGQTVEVTVTGTGPAAEQGLHVAQCDAAVGTDPTVLEVLANCGGDAVIRAGTRPTRQAYRVMAAFTSFTGRVVACGDDPQDCVIAVGGENYVETFDAGGELAIGIETVLRQQHHKGNPFPPRALDRSCDFILAQAERPGRQNAARMHNRGMRIGVAQHGDAHAALLDRLVRR